MPEEKVLKKIETKDDNIRNEVKEMLKKNG